MNRWKGWTLRLVAWSVAAVCVQAVQGQDAPADSYRIEDLGVLCPGCPVEQAFGTAINNLNKITGHSNTSPSIAGGLDHAFLADPSLGVIYDLGALPGPFGIEESYGLAINNNSIVAGYTLVDPLVNDEHRAFKSQNFIMTDLGTLGGLYAVATGINDADVIVGYSAKASQGGTHGDFEAFMWDSTNGMQDLGLGVGGADSFANAINNSFDIVGTLTNGGTSEAFLLKNAAVFYGLGMLPGHTLSYANDVSNGQEPIVVGESALPGVDWRPFVWNAGLMSAMDTINNNQFFGRARGINQWGETVGENWDPQTLAATAVWNSSQSGMVVELQSRTAVGNGWELVRAYDINDHGVITGFGSTNGQSRAFALFPEPYVWIRRIKNGVAGQPNDVSVSGLRRTGNATLYGGNGGQQTVVNHPSCGNITLDMTVVYGQVPFTADSQGLGVVTINVPGSAAGQTGVFQVIDDQTCELSKRFTQTF